jgi:hypothetical protein
MYAFGLAIHFEHKSEDESVDSVLKEKLQWNCMTVQEPVEFIVVYMNSHLETFLKSHDLDCVPLLAEVPFQEVLSPETFFSHLVNRDFEGFVLSVPKKLLKWKAFDEDERTSQRDALKILETRLSDENHPICQDPENKKRIHEILDSLSQVCHSSTPEDKQNLGPKKRPNKALYSHLYNSAATKFPTLNDYLDTERSSTDDEKLAEIVKSYESTIFEEMSKDFVDAGYKLDLEYEKEMRGHLRARVKAEAQKTLKKKINLD